MGLTNFDQIQVNSLIGYVPDASPFQAVFYVDVTLGSDGNTGKSPSAAIKTIAAAIAAAAAGDTIIIASGTYPIAASLVPKARQVFRAAVINQRKPRVIFVSSAIADMIQVDVDHVEFHGIEFQAGDNTCDNLIDYADAAASAGLVVNACVFNGADKTSVVGINNADATFAGTNLTVTNCLFRDLTGTCIAVGVLGFAYSRIAFNQFALDVNSGVGISLADTTTFAIGKGYTIEFNAFTGFDATRDEVGISIAGTEDATGAGIIRRNDFAYTAAAAITIDKLGFSEVQNFVGDATGGLLVDSGT